MLWLSHTMLLRIISKTRHITFLQMKLMPISTSHTEFFFHKNLKFWIYQDKTQEKNNQHNKLD